MKHFYILLSLLFAVQAYSQKEAESMHQPSAQERTIFASAQFDSCLIEPTVYFNQSTSYCEQEKLKDFCFSMSSRANFTNTNWPECGLYDITDPHCLTFVAGPDRLTRLNLDVQNCMGEGIQYGVYEVPDSILLHPSAVPLPFDQLVHKVSTCVFVEDPQEGERLLKIPTKEGRVYVIIFDPYRRSPCEVRGQLLNGAILPKPDSMQSHRPYLKGQQPGLGTDTICDGTGERVMRSAYDLGPAQYIWSVNSIVDNTGNQGVEHIVTFPEPGNYEVCVQMVFCGDTSAQACQTIVVTEKDDFLVRDTICKGEPISDWAGPFGIRFTPDSGMIDINQPGRTQYQAVYTDGFGYTQNVILDLFVRSKTYKKCILEGNQQSDPSGILKPLQVFPNPVRNLLTVEGEVHKEGRYVIELHYWTGQKVLSQTIFAGSKGFRTSLELGHLATGTYLMILKDDAGRLVGREVVVIGE